MNTSRARLSLIAAAFVAVLVMGGGTAVAELMSPLPTKSQALDKAVSADSLRAAAKTADAETLLGLAYLAPAGSPAREEIAEKAAKKKPDLAAVTAVVAVMMESPTEETVGNLLAADPSNALGYYLRGQLLHAADKDKEALDAFRQGAKCAEMRLYEAVTWEGLVKALDALNLKGIDRLSALTWMATRESDFGVLVVQRFRDIFDDIARDSDLQTKSEISDVFLTVAGQEYMTNFRYRWYADRLLEKVFQSKAEVAFAQKSPATNGYVAVTRAIVSTMPLNWRGIAENKESPEDIARYMPGRMYLALDYIRGIFPFTASELPESDRPAYEKAKEAVAAKAKELVDLVMENPDEIMGAYLKGLPPPRDVERTPWVSRYSYVERLMEKNPRIFRVAADLEAAMNAASDAAANEPVRRNMGRMMEINKAMITYLERHNDEYPPNLAALYEGKHLEPSVEAKSLLSGRPYVYVAAGKFPEKDAGKYITMYDNHVITSVSLGKGGYYACSFADGHAKLEPVEKVKEWLRARGK